MLTDFQIIAKNAAAPFTLKLHRGDGMTLLAMNWKDATPPRDFVGFALEYQEPDGDRFFGLKNRINFPNTDGSVNKERTSSRLSPIQKFRWVHFPVNAENQGEFIYRVTPVFMNASDELSYGEFQEAGIVLARETYPGKFNVAFTRGFVLSQAFVDRYVTTPTGLETLIPDNADKGLDFVPTHPKADEALKWMGFEARSAILEVLDDAIADESRDRSALFAMISMILQLSTRLEKLKKRICGSLSTIARITNPSISAESKAAQPSHQCHCRPGEAPAHEQPSAQQNHRGRWHERQRRRLRLHELYLARPVCSVQQRDHCPRQVGHSSPSSMPSITIWRMILSKASARRIPQIGTVSSYLTLTLKSLSRRTPRTRASFNRSPMTSLSAKVLCFLFARVPEPDRRRRDRCHQGNHQEKRASSSMASPTRGLVAWTSIFPMARLRPYSRPTLVRIFLSPSRANPAR